MENAHLETRIRKIERTNRWLIAACVIFSATALLAMRSPQNEATDKVQAKVFELLGPDGKVAAVLCFKDGGPGLYLNDSEGRERVAAIYTPEQGGFFAMDEAGHTRLGAALFGHGGAGFALHGKDMKGTSVLYHKSTGSLSFYGPEGEVLERVPTRKAEKK